LLPEASAEAEPGVRQPNLAPLLDTIFLVMVVVLVALIQMAPVDLLPVILVRGTTAPREGRAPQRVEVVVRPDDLPRVDGRAVTVDEVAGVIERIRSQRPVDAVDLLADARVDYGRVADLLARLRRPGSPPVRLGVHRRGAAGRQDVE